MTATTRLSERTLDRFDTPRWFTTELLKHHPIQGTILEPCVGGGAIARVLIERGYTVHTNDIDRSTAADYHADAASTVPYLLSRQDSQFADWIITNPPFNLADEIVPMAHRFARVGCAFLLPITWCESLVTGHKAEWLKWNPPCQIISLPRFCWRKGKDGRWATDSKPFVWFVWRKDQFVGKSFVSVPVYDIKGFYKNPDKNPELLEVSHEI